MTLRSLRPPASVLPPPKGPVLGWRSFTGATDVSIPGVLDLPWRIFTTSGRAALFQALRLLALPAGTPVLVPSYHCPTMIAPVVLAKLRPIFYGIDEAGLPQLDRISDSGVAPGAIIVAHYFGLPQSLSQVRQWCDARCVPLIEDCAHALFGQAGERPVGAWGDVATASLTKFLPVSELGLLSSATALTANRPLAAPSARTQLKGLIDVLERASQHGRPAGLAPLLSAAFTFKNRCLPPAAACEATTTASASTVGATDLMTDCDMARAEEAPTLAARWLQRMLPLERTVSTRQAHYDHFASQLNALSGASALAPKRNSAQAPYAFPLWVDDADRVYNDLRTKGMPVHRWDRVWPGVGPDPSDHGSAWSQHVLQLLCHQDLSTNDITSICIATRTSLRD